MSGVPRRVERAERADQRGRRIGTTLKDYERLAGRGPRRMAEALIARNNIRMKNLMDLPIEYRQGAIESLGPIGLLDRAHETLGLSLDRVPVFYTGTFPRDLGWGVDSAIAAVRLLLAGQVIGASTIARQQLERWTMVLAAAAGLTVERDESFTDFIARAWTEFLSWSPEYLQTIDPPTQLEPADRADEVAAVVEPTIDHRHLVLSDGIEICPALAYMTLSETMHARECQSVTTWESQNLLSPGLTPSDWCLPVAAVTGAIHLSLIQNGMVTAALLFQCGHPEYGAKVGNYHGWPHRFSTRDRQAEAHEWWAAPAASGRPARWKPRPQEAVIPNLAALMPLTPEEGLQPEAVAYLERQRWTYLSMKDGHRPAGRLYRDDEISTLLFDAHRYSAVQFAQYGLKMEARKFGDEFAPHTVLARCTIYALVSELAATTSVWCEGTVSAALKLVASSLRSSYWLWLEDDDRAMACLRCVLEQAARISVTVKKPGRAERMESVYNPPGRWLEAAGWRRLIALNTALGEYAHAQKRLDPVGPRLLLSALQLDASDNPDSVATARRHALDLVAEFAGRSIIDVLTSASPRIAKTAAEMLNTGFLDVGDEKKEKILNHVWELRDEAKRL